MEPPHINLCWVPPPPCYLSKIVVLTMSGLHVGEGLCSFNLGEDMMCFIYRGGGWSTICSRKLKVPLFLFNISNLKAGMGGGGGTLMSLYTERKRIKLLYCLNAVSCFKEWYYYWPKKPPKQNNLEWHCS